jgi:hypothetical protein
LVSKAKRGVGDMAQKKDVKNRDSKGKGKREGYYNGEPYGYSSSLPEYVILDDF